MTEALDVVEVLIAVEDDVVVVVDRVGHPALPPPL
jgi:hypothetical protein